MSNFYEWSDNNNLDELLLEINETIYMQDYLQASTIREEIIEIQKGLSMKFNLLRDYIKMLKLAHKMYLLFLIKYRSKNVRFMKSREFLSVSENEINIKRTLKYDTKVDFIYLKSIDIPSELRLINLNFIKNLEYALRLTDIQPSDYIDKGLVQKVETNECKVITSNTFAEALNIGKESTLEKKVHKEIILSDTVDKKNNKQSSSIVISKEPTALSNKNHEITILRDIDIQTCVLLYAFAKNYENQMVDNELFFSLSTLGDFIGKNLRGAKGNDISESIERLCSFRIRYTCNNYENKTINKLLRGFYSKDIDDLKLSKVNTITTNYISAITIESDNGTYYKMQFPLKPMYDELGQFENNINPKLFSLINKNDYMIVNIALQLATYSRMGKDNIKLVTLLKNLNIEEAYVNNTKPARFMASFIKKLCKASTYIHNIRTFTEDEFQVTLVNYKSVQIHLQKPKSIG